jgi:hypothetical protein
MSMSSNFCSKLCDDVEDLVPDRARVDLDVRVIVGQLAQQRLGDLFVRRDEDLAGAAVDHVERDLLVEQDVGQLLGELLGELLVRRLCSSTICFSCFCFSFGIELFLAEALREDTRTSMTMPDAARGDSQRGVLHVGGLFTEDGAEQALFRGQLGFALRRDLADENVAGLHLGADADDAVRSEVLEGFFTDIGNVAGDFFGSELGVAGADFEFVDVDRGVDVLLHDALGDHDGILEVVAVPRHEGDEHVPAEGEFAVLGVRAVGEDLAAFTLSPRRTIGFWLMQVPAFERMNLRQRIDEDSFFRVALQLEGIS